MAVDAICGPLCGRGALALYVRHQDGWRVASTLQSLHTDPCTAPQNKRMDLESPMRFRKDVSPHGIDTRSFTEERAWLAGHSQLMRKPLDGASGSLGHESAWRD